MATKVLFDTDKLTAREAQLVNALLSTQMTYRAGLLRAAGMSGSDPSFHAAVAQFAVEFMSNAFPDLGFKLVDE